MFETVPNHPRALHYAGVLAHQQGRNDEAIALIERSLSLAPERADCYSNLGIVFQSAGKLDAAIDAYRRAIGDLEEVFAAAAGALRPNGLLVLTLEHALAGEADIDYRLELHGRYSHSRASVERALTALGLQPAIVHAELRTESGAPETGLVIRAAKSAAACPTL